MKTKTALFIRTSFFLIYILSNYKGNSQTPVYLMQNATISTCSGTLLDEGGYASGYQGGITVMTFMSPDNRPFGFRIDSAHFSDDADRLYIYDGNSESAPLLTVITNQGGLRGLRTSGGAITVKFYASGYGVRGKFGWRSRFSCLDNPAPADFITVFNKLGDGNIDAADYDNDGDLDILQKGVIYRNDSGPDSLFYFDKKITPIGGWGKSSCTVTDFDNDNDNDIFVIGTAGLTGPTLYLNDGTGKFTSSAQVFALAWSGKTKAVDFNNDGKMDISYIGQNYYNTGTFRLYLNNGNGTFTEKTTAVPGLADSKLDWADCDNDGDQDLLVHGHNFASVFTKLFINNAGILSELAIGLTGTANGDLRFFDLNKDGKPDIINTGVDHYGTSSAIQPQILINKGNNSFDKLPHNLPVWRHTNLDFADYDNDGDVDIVANGVHYLTTALSAAVFKNEGNWQFKKIDVTTNSNSSVYWRDFNKDGRQDVFLCTNSDKSIIAQNMGNDVFKAASLPLPIIIDGEGEAALADIDQDGSEDIIFVGNMSDYDCVRGSNSMFIQKINWSYFPVPNFTRVKDLTTANNISFGYPFWRWSDFDSDGLLDAIVTNDADGRLGNLQPVIILKNYGKDSFNVAFNGMPGAYHAAAVDLDNDGKNELFVAPNSVYKWQNNKFEKVYEDNMGCVFYDICYNYYLGFADYNKDGFLDAAVNTGGNLRILKNDKTGKLVTIWQGPNDKFLKWVDIDNDGDLDLMGSTGAIENLGNDKFVYDVTLVGAYGEAGIADFNNDGLQDIFTLTKTPVIGSTNIYYNQNGTFFFKDKTPAGFPGVTNLTYNDGAQAFDVDGDGDNDILFSGRTCTSNGIMINKFNFKYPNLHLRKPGNEEKITIGSTYQINWTGKDIASLVTLHLSIDSGKTYSVLASNIPSTAVGGSYSWNSAGVTPARYCFIKVMDANTKVDINDKPFELKAVVVTAINDPVNGVKLNFFPNPSNGRVTLDLNVRSLKNVTLRIYNNLGVEQKAINIGISNGQDIRTSFDISNFPKGIYYLKLFCDKPLPILKCVKL